MDVLGMWVDAGVRDADMSKWRSAWRLPPGWMWDDVNLIAGNGGHILQGNPEEAGTLKGALYLPNPDTQNGWELHQIYGDPPNPAPQRRLGL